MPQNNDTADAMYRSRIEKLREAMKEFGLAAVVIEPGPAMVYLTGVRWGRSERTFALGRSAERRFGFRAARFRGDAGARADPSWR